MLFPKARPVMSLRRKAAFSYLTAVLIPLAIGSQWKQLSPTLQFVPGYVYLLLVALAARFLGLGPAVVGTLVSTGVLGFWILPGLFPPEWVALCLALFLGASIVVASISRRRSGEVSDVEERYRALVDLSPDAIGVSDDKSRIVFANAAFARLVGAADASQLLGRKTFDFVHPDSLDLVRKRIDLLATGQPAPLFEMKWVKLDGIVIDVETAGIPVRRDGKVFYQGFIHDVTERNKTAARIEESQRRMQALFDTAMDAILFVDSTGHLFDVNPSACELLGFTREEILKMKVGDFTPEDICEPIVKIWNDLTAGGKQGEYTIRRKDGTTREVECRTVANVLPGLHCAFMHDITARKEAERALDQLSARLLRLQDEERRRIARQLHGTTAQNLAALRLNLSRISRLAVDPAIKESVEESIALTEQSIGEIRTLSYLLHPPLIDEAGLLPSLRWFTRGFQERSGITVKLTAPEELNRLPPELETALFRIVQEALINVQRHSGSAVAQIRLERQTRSIRLEIEDEGRGLPKHLRNHNGALAASGVGIAGIQQRVRELGGEMQIESEDRGTRIVVNLPIPEE
jgi:PAS domain S-box-containing protein